MNNVPADMTPPTVSITSPTANATFSGAITVLASASDDVGVTSVSLQVDQAVIGPDTTSPYTFSLDTTTLANAVHTLTATAQDAASNTASNSIPVTVNNPVPDTTAPTVTIASPTNGGKVNGNVSVTVTVSDNVGVVKVELYVDNVLTDTSTKSPFSTKFNAGRIAAGAHALQCKDYDAAGNVGLSQIITVSR